MMKKTVSILLAVLILSSFMLTNVFAENGIFDIPPKGKIDIEAENFNKTTVDKNHMSSQLSYVSTSAEHRNTGALALVTNTEQVSYILNIKKAGQYMITPITSSSGSGVMQILENGEVISEGAFPSTGGATNAFPCEMTPVMLSEGTHEITMRIKTNGATAFFYYYQVEYLGDGKEFERTSGSYRDYYIPSKIEAEDYDYGTYYSADDVNKGGQYRKKDAVDIYSIDKTHYYIKLADGEYTTYTFKCDVANVYSVMAAVNDGKAMKIYFDGVETPVEKDVSGVVGFSETEIAKIYLPEGEHEIKVEGAGGVSVDYIRFATAEGKHLTLSDLQNGNVAEDESETNATVYKELYVAVNGSDTNDGSEEKPFATLKRAKEEIAKINKNMTGDIIVYIGEGTYKLSETEVFTEEHSGKNGYNVIFKGANHFSPSVISGGRKVTGWEKGENGIWKAPLDNIDYVRNLYINSYPARLAKSKYMYVYKDTYNIPGSKYTRDGMIVSLKNFPKEFKNPTDLEFVNINEWRNLILKVETFEKTETDAIFTVSREPFNSATYFTKGQPFYIQNAIEFLDEPGEFYWDSADKMIYYYPHNEEDMLTADAYIGETELLVKVRGKDLSNKASNIIFDNLTFRYGAWNFISKYGVVGSQADGFGVDGIGLRGADGTHVSTAQFQIDNADKVHIRNCEFSCLGSIAVSMVDSVSNCDFVGNIVRDTSSTGLMIGTPKHYTAQDGVAVCQNINVKNNVFTRTCGENYNNTAISAYYEKNIDITHNEIIDVPYTGITFGWGWEGANGYDTGNYNVSYNYLKNATTLTNDGGFIYSLGNLNGSTVHDNYMENEKRKCIGIYHDAGSANVETYRNVIYGTQAYIQVQDVSYGTHDIKVYDIYADTENWHRFGESDTITVEEATIIKPWRKPSVVDEIRESAGLEPEYKNLSNLAKIPEWHDRRTVTTTEKFFSEDDSGVMVYQAEDFMKGGEGVAYHKTLSPAKYNNPYRDDEVKLEKLTDRHTWVVSQNQKGEWLNYEIDIPADGEYYIGIIGKQSWSYSSVGKLYLDGELLTDQILAPNAKDIIAVDMEAQWPLTECGPFYMSAGKHILKWEFISSMYFDQFKIYTEEDLEREKLAASDVTNSEKYDEGVIVEQIYDNKKVEEKEIITFKDIDGHWAYDEILDMANEGLIKGVDGENFAPDEKLLRSQAVILAMRGAKIGFDEETWKETALTNDIIDSPDLEDEPITREEYISIVMKAYFAGKKRMVIENNPKFNDFSEVGEDYKMYILAACGLSLIKGDDEGNLNPKGLLTRAEAAVICNRLYKL